MDWTESRAWLTLNAVPGVGPSRALDWSRRAGAALEIIRHPEPWLGQRASTRAFADRRRLEQLRDRELAALDRCHAQFCTWADSDYPEALRDLDHPPPVLCYRGEFRILKAAALRIAIVGARACTPYGRSQAERFGTGLASQDCVVVSGGARGIDQAGMHGAHAIGGRVVGVLGSGIDRLYPSESRAFFERLIGEGSLLLSEFACGTRPNRGHFPRRNRILAALSRGVLVVQATTKSGSMITVGWALNLGRDVFALPGPVDSSVSAGPHRLLSDGAILVSSPGELLEHYLPATATEPAEDEAPLLARLALGDASLDQLAGDLRQAPEQIQLELVEWELQGFVTRLPGGLYHRCGPRRAR